MLGKKIASARKNVKLNQNQLASMLGITKRTLASYENNKSEPKLITLIRIAKYCKVSFKSLIIEKLKEENVNY